MRALRPGKWRCRIGALLLIAGVLGVGPALAAAALTQLPAPVQAVLDKHKLPADGLSVYVQDVAASAPLLTFNAQVPRNPASVMKLVTTLVALHELGPSYRFVTDVYAERPPANGVLEGNLYLKGQGDPFLVTESFWRLLKDLRHTGLVRVTGDLVIDGSYFNVPDVYRGDFDGRPYRAYNVLPHASLVNFFATNFKFFPEPDASRVRIEIDPPMSSLQVDNRLVITKEPCSWRNREVDMEVLSMGPQPRVVFSGSYPGTCGSHELLRAVADPAPYIFGAFKPMWEEMGGRIDGTGRAGLLPGNAVRVHRAASRPLSELITVMNKFSNNVMTRNLLLALGARTYGVPGTEDKGRRAVADWLLLHDIQAPELKVDNGSGLSRDGQMSALTLARLLLASWKSHYMPEFVSSLPLAALDGTMRKRFRASDLEGRAHMKTGLLNGVRAIGGFIQTRRGRNLVAVVLHNHPGVQLGSGTEVQDALIEWLFEQ